MSYETRQMLAIMILVIAGLSLGFFITWALYGLFLSIGWPASLFILIPVGLVATIWALGELS